MKTMLFMLCFAMYTSASIAEESVPIDMRELIPFICDIAHGSLEVTNLEVKQTQDKIQRWEGVASFEIGVNKERYREGIERIVKYFESKGIESSIQKFTMNSDSEHSGHFEDRAGTIDWMFKSINSEDHINLILVRDLSYRQRNPTPEELEYDRAHYTYTPRYEDGIVHEVEANAYVYSFDKSLSINSLIDSFRARLLILGEQGNPRIITYQDNVSSFNTIVANLAILENCDKRMIRDYGNNISIFPIFDLLDNERYYQSSLNWKTGNWHINNVNLGAEWLVYGQNERTKLGAKSAAIVLVPNKIEEYPDYLKIIESNVVAISQ